MGPIIIMLNWICDVPIYVRHKVAHKEITSTDQEEIKGNIRINNGHLNSVIKQVTLPVKVSTTAKDVVKMALVKFDLKVSAGSIGRRFIGGTVGSDLSLVGVSCTKRSLKGQLCLTFLLSVSIKALCCVQREHRSLRFVSFMKGKKTGHP